MSLLIPWIVFPLVVAAGSFGCGLLVCLACGRSLPPGLLLPTGFSLVVAASLFPPVLGVPALTLPLVALLTAAGLVLGRRHAAPGVDAVWSGAAALATYAAYAAPTVLSGRATFAGYIKLDDTATYLAMLDRFLGHGYDTSGLAPSTYEATVNTSLTYGYPMGSLLPVGLGHQILGQDTAWLWQPYLSFLPALLALSLYALLGSVVRSRPLRAAAAFLAAAPALLYGYALWGGIKELSAAALLAAFAALLPLLVRARSARLAVAPGVVAAALLGILSAGGVIWLAPLLAGFAVLAARTNGLRRTLAATGAGVAVTAVLVVPTLVAATHWLGHTGGFREDAELGNLGHPLRKLQVFGIWPVGDFRAVPAHLTVTHVLIGLLAAAAGAGAALAWRRRAWAFLVYGAGVLCGGFLYVWLASPWIGGKGLATASPVVPAAGLALLAAVVERRPRRVAAVVAGAAAMAVAGGIVWSNVLAYHDVWLAPRDHMRELEAIGKRFAGDGPTLLTDYDSYGARHFLRKLDPESAGELRRRQVTLRDGNVADTGVSPDIDEIRLDQVLVYRTLVLRRSPAASRPPSVYVRVWHGAFYDVWQRPLTGAPTIVEHLSLGDRLHAAAVPSCADVLRLAREAGASGELIAAPRLGNAALDLGPSNGELGAYGERIGTPYLTKKSTFEKQIDVSDRATYDIGVAGSFLGRITLEVDGREVASARHELAWPGLYEPLATLALEPGTHTIRLVYHGEDLHPGSSGYPPFGTGPLIVGVETDSGRGPERATSAGASGLCGRSLDWVEARR